MVAEPDRQTAVGALLAFAFHVRSVLLLLLGLPLLLALLERTVIQPWEFAAGAGLALFGVGLRLASMRRIGKKARVRRCAPEVLVCSGPFRFSRNPLYVANVSVLLGLTVAASGQRLALAAGLGGLAIYTLVVLHEERRLEEELGQPYLDYKAQVPRWFPLPWRLAPPTPNQTSFSWPGILSRERFLVPGAALGLVGVFLVRRGTLPLVEWLEEASSWLHVDVPVLCVAAMLAAGVIHGVHSERKRKRREAKKRAQAQAQAAELLASDASGSDRQVDDEGAAVSEGGLEPNLPTVGTRDLLSEG